MSLVRWAVLFSLFASKQWHDFTNGWFPGSAWEPNVLQALPAEHQRRIGRIRGRASDAVRSQAGA